MIQTLTHDGWMGIAPTGRRVTMRSLDFWRIEKGLIRENWVLVDLLDLYQQIGVDVFARMREFNKVRPGLMTKPEEPFNKILKAFNLKRLRKYLVEEDP